MKKTYTAEPREIITDYDLLLAVQRYEPIQRKAVLFAIATGLEPDAIEVLDWETVRLRSWNKKAIRILDSLPRHLFSDLVFWEDFEGVPIILTGLREICEEVAGRHTWAQYLELTREITLVNASASEFFKALAQEVFDRC